MLIISVRVMKIIDERETQANKQTNKKDRKEQQGQKL